MLVTATARCIWDLHPSLSHDQIIPRKSHEHVLCLQSELITFWWSKVQIIVISQCYGTTNFTQRSLRTK